MMATASLTMPYPKMMEKSLGYFAGLMSVSAATESVAEMVALYLTMSAMFMTSYYLSYPMGMIQSRLSMSSVSPNIVPKATMVPKNPKMKMYLKFF